MTAVTPFEWDTLPSRRDLLGRIERLAISADAKVVLAKLAAATVDVGGRIIEVGRRILAFAFEMAKAFPNTLFGVIMAMIVSMLIASIPFLGAVLGPLVAPLFLAFGLVSGAVQDIKDGALRQRIRQLEAEFRAVAA